AVAAARPKPKPRLQRRERRRSKRSMARQAIRSWTSAGGIASRSWPKRSRVRASSLWSIQSGVFRLISLPTTAPDPRPLPASPASGAKKPCGRGGRGSPRSPGAIPVCPPPPPSCGLPLPSTREPPPAPARRAPPGQSPYARPLLPRVAVHFHQHENLRLLPGDLRQARAHRDLLRGLRGFGRTEGRLEGLFTEEGPLEPTGAADVGHHPA